MKEELLTLWESLQGRIANLENQIFANIPGKYSLFKAIFDDYRNQMALVLKDDSQLDAAKATLDNIANNLNTIEAKFSELSVVSPLNMNLIAEETPQEVTATEVSVAAPQIEMPAMPQQAAPMTSDVPQEPPVPNVTESEIDALLNTLNNSGPETVYPQEQVVANDTINNVTDAFTIKPQ